MPTLYRQNKNASLRKRKEAGKNAFMIACMDKYPKYHWTVNKVLRKYPCAASFFSARQLRCPGCGFNRYCTLADVACSYQMETMTLTNDLRSACSLPQS